MFNNGRSRLGNGRKYRLDMRNSIEIAQELSGRIDAYNAETGAEARARLSAEIRALTEELRNAQSVEAARRMMASSKPDVTPEEKEVRSFSIAKALREGLRGGLTGLESEMCEEARREFQACGRSLEGIGIPSIVLRYTYANSVTAAEGAEFKAVTQWSYIEALRANLVASKVGVRYLSGLQGNVRMVRGGGTAASWLDEEAAATMQKPGFASTDLTPHRLQVLTGYTQDLLRQSALPVEDLIWDDISKAHAAALDAAVFSGSGSSGQPLGIAAATGVNAVNIGSALTYAKLVELETAMAAQNGLYGDISIVTTPAVYGAMKTTPQVNGYPLYLAQDGKANGYNVEVTSGVASGKVIMGNFSEAVIGQWGGLDLIVDPYASKDKAVVEVTAYAYHDVAVRQPKAFAVGTISGS